MTTLTQQQQEECNDYLVAFRDSGQHPMSAGNVLQDVFGLTRAQAREAILTWIKSFRG
jgi:hypothetical protein